MGERFLYIVLPSFSVVGKLQKDAIHLVWPSALHDTTRHQILEDLKQQKQLFKSFKSAILCFDCLKFYYLMPRITPSGLNRPYVFYNIDAIFVTLADTGKYLSCASLQVRSAMRKYKGNLVVELKLSCQHCQTCLTPLEP